MIDLSPRKLEKYTLSFHKDKDTVELSNYSFDTLFAIATSLDPSVCPTVRNAQGQVIYPAPVTPNNVVILIVPEFPGVTIYEPLMIAA